MLSPKSIERLLTNLTLSELTVCRCDEQDASVRNIRF